MPLLRLTLFCSLLIAGIAAAGSASGADQWTSLNGTSTVSGEMLGLWNGRVLLRLDGGRRVSVRMDDLRAESRILAEKRMEELQQRMQEQREAIRTLAEEAAAPAPKDQPALPQPPSYRIPAADEGLGSYLAATRDQLLAGHLRVAYDTLPPAHRQRVDALAAALFAKLDERSFETTRTTLAGVADVVVNRQRWLLSHPRFAQLSEEQQASVVTAAQLIAAITSDEVLNLQTLRSRPFSESVASMSDALAPYVNQALSEYAGMIEMMQFEVSPGQDSSLVVQTKLPVVGTVDSRSFVQFEGHWVQGDRPETAGSELDELLKLVQAIPDGSLRLPSEAEAVIQQLSLGVSALRQAPGRRDFHRELDAILPQLAVAISQWSAMKMPGLGYPGQPMAGFPGYSGGSDMLGSEESAATMEVDANAPSPLP